MSTIDPIATQLDRLYSRCCTPRHEQRIQQRWRRYPALNDRSLDDVATTLYDPAERDHNAVLADLLRAHRAGDPDATIVLLVALRPIVRSLLRHSRSIDVARANAWAAVAVRLAATNPDEAQHARRPFLGVLRGRVRRDYYRLHLAADRQISHGAVSDHDETTGPGSDVEDNAVARYTLTNIATRLQRGDINRDDWQQLVHHRVTNPGHTTSAIRANVWRTSNRVARLVGHAA